MKIIAFSGKKQSGKDIAVADIARRPSISNATFVLSFAHGLKRIVRTCFCDEYNPLETDEQKSRTLLCGKTAREVLQIVGTDWFRSLDSNCWVRAYRDSIERACNADRRQEVLVLTPDVRFPNEVKCIQDLGGHVIRLLRAPFPDDKHESETALDAYECLTLGQKLTASEAVRLYCDEAHLRFDAIIDNREMTIEEQNEAVWKLVNEKHWI